MQSTCKGAVKGYQADIHPNQIFLSSFKDPKKNDLIVLFYKNFKNLNNYLDSLLKIQVETGL